MSELVVMPKQHWTDTLDSVRARAHINTPIKSGELAGILNGLADIDMGGGFSAFANGSITFTSDLTEGIWVEHGLGAVPDFFLMFAEDKSPYTKDVLAFDVIVNVPIDTEGTSGYQTILKVQTNGGTDRTNYTLRTENASYIGSEYVKVSTRLTSTSFLVQGAPARILPAGRVYHWFCGVTKSGG